MTPSESSIQSALRDPDVRLMLQVREGDTAAFEELMVRFQGRVTSVLKHLVGNQDLAEDLTQDVFLRVYRARQQYEPGAKFTTWLFTIVNNVALNSLRGKSRRPEVQFGGKSGGRSSESDESQRMENLVQASSSMIPARRLDKLEMREVVKLAIDSLGERQKIALLLHRFEGMSYVDIAETMELTPQAVKSLLCRARLSLKELLLPYVESGKLTK
ncbi:MAG: RNA polymerase sigma factor [Thermoguttaceae bacterium]